MKMRKYMFTSRVFSFLHLTLNICNLLVFGLTLNINALKCIENTLKPIIKLKIKNN